jgi:dTDP-4-amino-4,6-dideoxygalactose transaminase
MVAPTKERGLAVSEASERIPFTRPCLFGNEIAYVTQAISRFELVGDGPSTREAETKIAEISGTEHVLMTPSCTDALDMSGMLLNLVPGDEVIVPGFTFTSTATAFAQRNARLVFADVDPKTNNIDPSHVETLISDRTRAIVMVHYAGVACDVESLIAIAKKHDLAIIEDNAHGFGGRYKDLHLGSIGDMATLSFHATKNIQCGEGGALLTKHQELADRAHILREKGTNRKAFLNGAVDKYTWIDLGSSFLAPDYVAAFLIAQLEVFDSIQEKRKFVWDAYDSQLKSWADDQKVVLPTVPDYAHHTSHMFWMKFEIAEHRIAFMKHMEAAGVSTAFHYQSLAQSPAGKKFGRTDGTPECDRAADTLIRLPLFADMTEGMTDRVIETVLGWQR